MEYLENMLVHTYHPDKILRQQAEKALEDFASLPGSFTGLSQFLQRPNTPRELRQAAGILMKNRIRQAWESEYLVRHEKESIKPMILDTLMNESDNSIRSLLSEIVRIVSEFDYPQSWPDLIPTLIVNIQSNDILKLYNALFCLRTVIKRFEYNEM